MPAAVPPKGCVLANVDTVAVEVPGRAGRVAGAADREQPPARHCLHVHRVRAHAMRRQWHPHNELCGWMEALSTAPRRAAHGSRAREGDAERRLGLAHSISSRGAPLSHVSMPRRFMLAASLCPEVSMACCSAGGGASGARSALSACSGCPPSAEQTARTSLETAGEGSPSARRALSSAPAGWVASSLCIASRFSGRLSSPRILRHAVSPTAPPLTSAATPEPPTRSSMSTVGSAAPIPTPPQAEAEVSFLGRSASCPHAPSTSLACAEDQRTETDRPGGAAPELGGADNALAG
eukprot:scaffold180306_cov30-Tisochrysis_lutea.AAC.4